MTEKKDPEFKYMDANRKKLLEFYPKDRLTRAALNFIGYSICIIKLLTTKEGWEALRDPMFRRMLLYREGRTGLLEDSIIQNPLYVPTTQNGASLETITAAAGRWTGYDFNREGEFGKKALPRHQGKIVSFVLDEIRDNKPSDYTPTALFQFFDVAHLLCLETPSVDYLVEQGLLETRTYREAFQKAGRYELSARSLDFFEIADKEIYQVTPKGNGLIFLAGDGGEKVPKEKKVKKLLPAYQQ